MTEQAEGADRSQIEQTVEMFEAIAESQPLDVQSLEVLREAYGKLERETDFVATSRRIAEVYVQLGQISSAILEYESLLQRVDDPDIRAALSTLEGTSADAPEPVEVEETPGGVDDGRAMMRTAFVEGREISEVDFDQCWPEVDLTNEPTGITTPFIQLLAAKSVLPVEKSLTVLSVASKLPFIPIERYDFDIELARTFPREPCLRWCVMPFDRFGKNLMVATCNPFNRRVAEELATVTNSRILWYLVGPLELMQALGRVYRLTQA